MIQITYNGIPGTLDNGVVSFVGTSLESAAAFMNAEVQAYADANPGYWPDLSEVALLLLREIGTVEIISSEPLPFDPEVAY